MADEINYYEEEAEVRPTIPFGVRAGIFGVTGTAAIGFDIVSQLGIYGLAFGLFGAGVVTYFSPELVELGKGCLPEKARKRLHHSLTEFGRRLNQRAGDVVESDEEVIEAEEYEVEEREDKDDNNEGGDEENDELAAFEAEWKAAQEEREDQPSLLLEHPGAIIGKDPNRRIDMAANYQPDANELLVTGLFAVGCQGSGKTVTLARFLEQYIKRYRLGCLVFDSQGDFKSLIEDGFCPDGIIATPENMPSMDEVVAQRLQVVVDLEAWSDEGQVGINWERCAMLMAEKIQELMLAQRRITPRTRIPCLVAIDEVHLWVPQTPPSYLSKETAKRLLDAVIALSTTGRKLGTIPFLATQRIARVNKDVIGSVETRIFGKADLDNDLTRYREYINKTEMSNKQIRALKKGKMVVCFSGQKILVQFYNRETRHISHTPRIPEEIEEQPATLPESARSRIYHHTYSTGSANVARRRRERAESLRNIPVSPSQPVEDPKIRTLHQRPAPQKTVEAPKARQIDPADLAKAFVLWQAGARSVRKLETAAEEAGYGWSNGKCRELIEAMREYGLIPKRESVM